MAEFQVTDSFDIRTTPVRLGGKHISNENIKAFWQDASEYETKHGCYIFSMRAGRGTRPWYVGKASSLTLEKECFSLHKINIYNNVVGNNRGVPTLTFVIPKPSRGRTPQVEIDEIEEYLIGFAASRNMNLANKRKLPNQKWSIQGVVPGSVGAPGAAVTAFKTLMGI